MILKKSVIMGIQMIAEKLLRLIGGVAVAFTLAACSSAGAQNTTTSALRSDDPWADVENMMYDANYQGVVDEATRRMNRDGKSVEGLTLRGIAYAKLEKQFMAYDDLIAMSIRCLTLVTLCACTGTVIVLPMPINRHWH